MLARHAKGFDIVFTQRRSHGENAFKRLTSVAFYRVLNALSGKSFVPGAADFSLLSRQAVDALGRSRETHRFVRGLVHWIGFRSTVLAYDPAPRIAGETKYTVRKMVRFSADAILSFSTAPLRISILLGFVLVLLAAAELSHALYMIVSGRQSELVPGWTSLIFSVLGIGGVQLIILGVIGQYIGMIFEQVKNRPLYVLRRDVIEPEAGSPAPPK